MHAILVEGLGRRFGDRWAVKDLSLQIEQGEVFGLLGPNGAGKTTTMRMIATLIAPTVGHVEVCGYDVVRDPYEIRRRLGILTETPGLYESLSAQRNLEFYAKLYGLDPGTTRRQIERYLKLLGLWERRADTAGTFSKGMKQKLSMVRTLLHEPQVLILDEPTSALDPEGAKQVRDFIESMRGEGRTIILCTHNLAEAQSLCDRVAIIKRTLLRVGTPRDMQRGLYGRKVEVRISNSVPDFGQEPSEAERELSAISRQLSATNHPAESRKLQDEGRETDSSRLMTMNDLAVLAASADGVGDVAVAGETLLISMVEPELTTPGVVRALVMHGADVTHVAEVEYPLERAYLDLVSRYDTGLLLAAPEPQSPELVISGQ